MITDKFSPTNMHDQDILLKTGTASKIYFCVSHIYATMIKMIILILMLSFMFTCTYVTVLKWILPLKSP